MIKTFDYLQLLEPIEDEIMTAIRRVLHSGHLILGPETEAFEREFAEIIGVKHCIGVTSGTAALHLTLMALDIGPGDEVITVANTCTPTVAAIALTGATPILVDVRDQDLMINSDLVEQAITEQTKCILPVHLWGQSVDIASLCQIADRHNIPVVEDCAQAQGTHFEGKHVGTFGVAGCFSFYPTKNLGAYGDAGAIITNDDTLAASLRRKRMYGYTRRDYAVESGTNARIAEIQSAILRVKLQYLPGWLAHRRVIAARYQQAIHNAEIRLPHIHKGRDHAFHQYVIRCRNRAKVIETLEQHNIGFGIHYATPIHHMPAYQASYSLPVTEQASTEILSLPIHEALTDTEVEYIIDTLNKPIDL